MADMDERIKKAFDFSADLTKQLITLSTGIITLTIAFKKDFFPPSAHLPGWLVYCIWYAFLASIAMGIMTLSALTGTLDAKEKTNELTIFAGNIVTFSILQFVTFGAGLGFTIYFAARGLV